MAEVQTGAVGGRVGVRGGGVEWRMCADEKDEWAGEKLKIKGKENNQEMKREFGKRLICKAGWAK